MIFKELPGFKNMSQTTIKSLKLLITTNKTIIKL